MIHALKKGSQSNDVVEAILKTLADLALILKGKESVIEFSLAAILAGGHILLEGPPGTGKTSVFSARPFAGFWGFFSSDSDD